MSLWVQNSWVYSLENEHATKYIHNYFCACGHSFRDTTAVNQPFAPDVTCPQCNNKAFIDTNAFKKGQLLEEADHVSWGVDVFENRTLWGVYIYIDLPPCIHKEMK